MNREEILETTLGDLIEQLMEETMPYVRDEKEAYKVIAFALMDLLGYPGTTSKIWGTWH